MSETYSNDWPNELNNEFLTMLSHSNVGKSFMMVVSRLMSLVNVCLDPCFKSYFIYKFKESEVFVI